MKKTILLSTLLIATAFTSCKKDKDDDTTTPAVTSSEILTDFTNKIALDYYNELNNKATALKNAVTTLQASQTSTNLQNAKQAWINARVEWEQCEGFLFGPVSTLSLDPAIDDWPVNRVDLDSLLASPVVFTQSYLNAAPTTLKGFHPIEYLLFGNNSQKQIGDFTAREFEYLTALAENLNSVTAQIENSWLESGGNFQSQVINAGQSGSQYASRQDAMLEIANALIGIIDEVAAGKIEEPFVAQDSTLEESHFSKNTWTDFKNDLIGARNVYKCSYQETGKGLTNFVNAHNKTLDTEILQQFDAAINNISAYTTTFGSAIFNQPAAVLNTQTVLNNLKTKLEEGLIPLIQEKVTD